MHFAKDSCKKKKNDLSNYYLFIYLLNIGTKNRQQCLKAMRTIKLLLSNDIK